MRNGVKAREAVVVAVTLLALSVSACAKKQPPVARPMPVPPPGAATGRPPAPPEPVSEPTVVPPEPIKEDPVGARSLDDLNRESPLKPVFFALDSAEIGGDPDKKRAASIQTLYKVLHDWFPGAAQLANTGAGVQEWKGARPMLPDGPPLIGATGIPGVWINLGHGSSGWALSCGCARAVADLMSKRTPEVDIEGLGIERLGL
jgi:glycine/D-amino acid oxidase-like deaminating enzyme